MIIGVIGSGGREHAICEKILQSKKIEKLYCFPGNAGTNSIAKNVKIKIDEFDKIKNFVKNIKYQQQSLVFLKTLKKLIIILKKQNFLL